MAVEEINSFHGFSKLNRKERYAHLLKLGHLKKEDLKFLKQSSFLEPDLAEKFIENSLGYFPLPLGVATHFCIDGKDLAIPMVVEETSIIAAACKTAKWVKSCGGIRTSMLGDLGIGQIHFAHLKNPELFKKNYSGSF